MSVYAEPAGSRILVVDDMPANVQLLVRLLAGRGYAAQAVGSGAEALEAARSDPPDLILLDINMPGMDGFEVCQHLKADLALRDIPVLFISALHEVGDKVKAFQLGGVDYVTKPFQIDEVFARVETHLKLRLLQRQLGEHNQHLEQVVEQRTRELEAAYLRVQELNRIQADFLSMISHEMRTPAHGLLGLGELLMRLCPPSDARSRYAGLFAQSQDRLLGLFEDVSLISEADVWAPDRLLASPCTAVLEQVRAALPGVELTLAGVDALEACAIGGSSALCVRALKTIMHVALAFSRDKRVLHLRARADADCLCLRLELDALVLSQAQTQGFFAMASPARASSAAEGLGLAPVVAHHILRALGGAVVLVKGEGDCGYLEATLQRAAGPVPVAGAAA